MELGAVSTSGSGGITPAGTGQATRIGYFTAATTLGGAIINVSNPTTANPGLFNETALGTGSTGFSGGTSNALGNNLICYGEGHATKAGDLELRDGTTIFFNYDKSVPKIIIGAPTTAGETRLNTAHVEAVNASSTAAMFYYRSVDTGIQVFSGGLDLGSGYLRCYGETHATLPGQVEIGSGLGANILLTGNQLIATHPTATNEFAISHNTATGSIRLYGGSTSSASSLQLYAQTHGTLPQRAYFRGTTRLHFVHPTSTTEFIVMNESADGALGIYGGSAGTGGTIKLFGITHGSLPAEIQLSNTAGVCMQITNAGRIHIGAPSGGQQHRWNGAEGTPGAVVLTLANGPTGTTGNPAKYIKLTINDNTAYVIPAWAA